MLNTTHFSGLTLRAFAARCRAARRRMQRRSRGLAPAGSELEPARSPEIGANCLEVSVLFFVLEFGSFLSSLAPKRVKPQRKAARSMRIHSIAGFSVAPVLSSLEAAP